MEVKEIMKDEDIHLRLNKLAIESDPEFKKERGDRSLADEHRDGGFKHKIEGKNGEDLHEDASHSRHEIKEDEDIVLRLNKVIRDINSDFKAKHEDQREDLNAHRYSNGGFKHKIEGKNAEDRHEDASHSRYEIKEHEDIVLRLNKFIRAINSDFKAEHDDQREDLNGHRILADEEWDHAEDPDKDPTNEEWNRSDVEESQETKKKLEEEIDPSDSGLGTVEVLEKIVVEYQEFIDYAIEMFKDGEKKKREECGRVLLQLNWSLNKGYKRVNNEMQWLKKNNEIETLEAYFKKRPYVTEIFCRIEEVIATIYRCIEEDLSLSADKLNQWKAELGEWILRIRELKANKKNNAQGNGGIEAKMYF